MSNVAQDTRLVRSFPRGTTIHLRGCSHAKRVVPWAWAEGREDDEWLLLAHLKACRVCLPDLAKRQAARA